jgi:hypothetical protein
VKHCVKDCSRKWRRSARKGRNQPSSYCAHFGCYSPFTAVYIFVNKLLDLFTSLLTLPGVNKSFNKFNGLSRENHFERFERLHRFERFKKIYLTRRPIELFRTFNRVVQNVQDETSEPIIRAL